MELVKVKKDEFEKVLHKKDIPTDMPEFEMSGIWICQALVDAKFVDSTSQARRDIKSKCCFYKSRKK